jgi:hypothetical protein
VFAEDIVEDKRGDKGDPSTVKNKKAETNVNRA